MRICHLSWEYPPVVYGGLGRHVHAVAREQARAGHDVVVISHVGIDNDDATTAPTDEIIEGVRVIRVVRDAPFVDFEAESLLGWVAGLASSMSRAGLALAEQWSFQVVHAHDWITAHAAAIITDALTVPWVHTIHATEAGRHQGWLPGALSRSIHSIEGWSVQRADQVIVCSAHMRWEVERLFGKSDSHVIPNGVDASAFLVDAAERDGIRAGYSTPLIVHTGRLEWEKGAHTLIEALPRIRRAFPGVQCVIAGRGSQSQALRELARRKRVSGRVHMPGWLPESELRALVAAADVAVVPSIYEPFGIVALEAAGVQTPVVAAKSGGLAEFLDADAHGYGFAAGDPVDLARAVHACLADPDESAARAVQAYACVRDEHRWDVIAGRTVEEYSRVRRKERGTERAALSVADLPLDGNLLFEAT